MARYWEFHALQDEWKNSTWCDSIPRVPRLYIGGLAALYQEPDPLQTKGITHVLSVLDFDIGDTMKSLKGLGERHLQIRVEDTEREDLARWFAKTNGFIEEALKGDSRSGGVFVHCAMGVSRSATVVVAYVMWKFGVGREEALGWVKEGRRRVRPNEGFWRQLGAYEDVLRKEREKDKAKL